MGKEDPRRPRMERGLAVWTDRTQRFYPLEAIRAHGGALIDELDGRRTLVCIDPTLDRPACLRTDATACVWQDDTLVLDTGECVRGGVLYDARGATLTTDRPLQSLVCWYAYTFSFPGGQIYEG
jgi:hypothetical protein